jgi:hypothetical protein
MILSSTDHNKMQLQIRTKLEKWNLETNLEPHTTQARAATSLLKTHDSKLTAQKPFS